MQEYYAIAKNLNETLNNFFKVKTLKRIKIGPFKTRIGIWQQAFSLRTYFGHIKLWREKRSTDLWLRNIYSI